jgi:hypothetical protein
MKKLILSCLAIAALFSCEQEKENTLPIDVNGYIVEKEIVLAHWDTTKPVVMTASIFCFSHSFHSSSSHSSHSSFHSSSHVSSHGSYHSSFHSSHPMYHNMYHPTHHPHIYGFRPHTHSRKIEEETITFIGTEFDIYAANKFSINKVSVDSLLFSKLKRGQKVHFKNGTYQGI